MKISYRTHPILERLHKQSLGQLPLFTSDLAFASNSENIFSEFLQSWHDNKLSFSKKIHYISEPFYNAVMQSFSKLYSALLDNKLINEWPYTVKGTFCCGDAIYMANICVFDHKLNQNSTVFEFTRAGSPLMWYWESSNTNGAYKMWLSNEVTSGRAFKGQTVKSPDEIAKTAVILMAIPLLIDLFKNFASVETKELPAGKLVKDVSCKYVNDTKLDILYLDSKWFTTLVKSDAFKVRGHFRLQPKKINGIWSRELIWINEFQKSGYTAPARKIQYNPND